ncbi:reverse transcriptase N-terminal domain-containing protein [Okeania sp. SIO3I5]|nr:reverse transcriptase N-terminal domain-containing protein [Okeania sp. SIO3I5]
MQKVDTRKVLSLQRLVLKSHAARMLAVRQVSELNSGILLVGSMDKNP